MQIICEFATTCSNDACYYKCAKVGTIVFKALCAHRKKRNKAQSYVNIVEVSELNETNPNITFKRMRDGL